MTVTAPIELSQMKTLAELAGEARSILRDMERIERAPVLKKAQEYNGRTGYLPGFLEDFGVPVPQPTGVRHCDIAPLLDGSGTELKYEHFSVVMSKSRRLAMYVACNINGQRSVKIRRGQDRSQSRTILLNRRAASSQA